jgi:hypothetical protein
MPEILTSIITYTGGGPAIWTDFIKEISRTDLTRVALFLTGLDSKGRKDCYAALTSLLASHDFSIPFVHARDDMHPDEYSLLMEKFGTLRFNLHPNRVRSFSYDLPEDLRKRIYIENVGPDPDRAQLEEADLAGFAGVCLDFAHLEMARLNHPEHYRELTGLLDRTQIGVNHVSAVIKRGDGYEDFHAFHDLAEFDYLRAFPRRYVADFVAIELCEPLKKQLQVKVKLEEMWG